VPEASSLPSPRALDTQPVAGLPRDGTACSLGTDGTGAFGTAFVELYGSRVTNTDSSAPGLTGPTDDVGLRAPGTRAGDEPLTFSATDNVGIRRAEIVDVTDAANPRVVATDDYASTQTAQKTGCDFTRPRPCPDLKSETIAASPAIAGKRTLLLRVTDAAGNQTVSLPFAVGARGPVNGSGGGDGARVVAGFPGHAFRGRGKKRHRIGVLRPTKTVGYGHGTTVRGILRNAAGQPVGGAEPTPARPRTPSRRALHRPRGSYHRHRRALHVQDHP
jgi:hypothetical protein